MEAKIQSQKRNNSTLVQLRSEVIRKTRKVTVEAIRLQSSFCSQLPMVKLSSPMSKYPGMFGTTMESLSLSYNR